MTTTLNERLEAALAYCDDALRKCSTDPEQTGYDQGFDDAIRGMAAEVKAILNGQASTLLTYGEVAAIIRATEAQWERTHAIKMPHPVTRPHLPTHNDKDKA